MKRRDHIVIAGCAALLSAGCVDDIRIATSPALAGAERLELTGMGGGERGQLRIGSSAGRFTRAAFRQESLGTSASRNVGGGSFELAGPDVNGRLQGTCDYEEEEQDLSALVLTTLRFQYRCNFRQNETAVAGGLVLEEVPLNSGKRLSGRTRAGEARFGNTVLTISAIHHMEGARIASGTPLGYKFNVDGREVGAVDLNGLSKTIYVPPVAGGEREAVIAASLALSILWDPME